jgi:hypothetical protein
VVKSAKQMESRMKVRLYANVRITSPPSLL